MKNTNRFTFFELLLIIAIAALLLFMLPAVSALTSELNKEAECKNNLKKIYDSMISYSEEFDGSFPVRFNKSKKLSPWFYVLAEVYPDKFPVPYWSYPKGRKFWHCPACPLNNWEDSCSSGASDYGLNILAYERPDGKITYNLKESASMPAQKFLLADIPLNSYRPYIQPTVYLSISNRHNLKANYIFFDGHLDEFTRRQVFRWSENNWIAFSRSANQTPWNCSIQK